MYDEKQQEVFCRRGAGENLLVSDFWFLVFSPFCSSNISFNARQMKEATANRARRSWETSHGGRHDLSDFINFQNLCDPHRVKVYPQARAYSKT